MKRATVLLVAFAFVGLVIAGSVNARPIKSDEIRLIDDDFFEVQVTVDGEKQSVPLALNEKGEGLTPAEPGLTLKFGTAEDGAEVTLAANVLFDPVITTAIGVVDFGAPSSFAVAVAAPLNPPIAAPTVGTLDISGSFSDGGDNGGSVTPFLGPLIAQATIEGGGVADVGPAVVFPGPINIYGPFSVPYNFDCTTLPDGQCDSFDLQVSFTGSGDNDTISFTARHEIEISSVSCAITDLTAGDQTLCDPCTNTYSQDVIVTYESPPTSGTLDVNGQSFPIGTSPQTVTLLGLCAEGNPVDVTAAFSADPDCELTVDELLIAPDVCNFPEEITDVLISEIGQLETDGALNQGQSNALINKLYSMLKQLGKGNTAAAVAKLYAFLEQIENFITDGFLTPEEAQPLTDCAEAILNQIFTNG